MSSIVEVPRLPDRPGGDPYMTYLDALDSAESRRTMRGCLDRVARLLTGDENTDGSGQPWHLLRYEHTTRIRVILCEQGWSPAYVNKHLVALRRVLKEAWRLGLMTAEDYQRAADLATVDNVRLPHGQHVPGEVLGAALAACDADDGPAGRRDAALLAVLYSTGARRAEIAGLGLGDYDSMARSFTVTGKRNKQRLVYLTSQAVARVELWLAVRGRVPGALFGAINKAGRLRVREGAVAAISGQAIADILTRRLAQAEAPARSPHDFRRTFIGELLDAGVDLATAQGLVGHASPATTARYDRRPERARRAAVDRLSLPEAKPLR